MFKLHPFLPVAVAVACVACGASFSAHEGGNGAFAGSGNAGEGSGGPTSSAGSLSIGDAGEIEAGGTSSAGQGSTGGTTSAGGTATGTGGTATSTGGTTTGLGGRGNWGNGGRRGSGGGSSSAECSTLEQEYKAAVEQARVCDKGSTDQCSPSSVAQAVGGCGCPVLINAKSQAGVDAKKAYQAYQDANCEYWGGSLCDIACPPAATASCAQQSSGTGNAFVCTTGIAIQN
ncbi:MAG TPA: hypothetical protein VGC79_19305 [Polyangiaceae bacterium]